MGYGNVVSGGAALVGLGATVIAGMFVTAPVVLTALAGAAATVSIVAGMASLVLTGVQLARGDITLGQAAFGIVTGVASTTFGLGTLRTALQAKNLFEAGDSAYPIIAGGTSSIIGGLYSGASWLQSHLR